MADAKKQSRLVIRNIGLLLSGDLQKPILDADTVVAVDGKITAVGKGNDVDTEGSNPGDRCQGHYAGARTDRQPRASGRRRLDPTSEPDWLD